MTTQIVTALLIGVVLFVSIRLAVFYQTGSTGPEFSPPEEPPEEQGADLPEGWEVVATWKVGDSWTSAITTNETEYTLTMTIIGEEEAFGVDCYVANLTYKPDTPWANTGMRNDMQSWWDKAMLRMMRVRATGESFDFGRWWEWIYIETHSYTVEGNQTNYFQIDERDYYVKIPDAPIANQHSSNVTRVWIKTEAETENVKVVAGEFECYKTVVYDVTEENILSTSWFSEEAKTLVKSINYETGETSELLSYSV